MEECKTKDELKREIEDLNETLDMYRRDDTKQRAAIKRLTKERDVLMASLELAHKEIDQLNKELSLYQ